MRKILALLLFGCCILAPSCSAGLIMDDVETYIDERPDSALAVLSGIDAGTLQTRELQARYALLYTMALDKNYMDITAPGLLDPAWKYYVHHGAPDERMKTWYYQGRIRQSQHDFRSAIVSFCQAEQFAPKVRDQHALGVFYLAFSHLFNRVYNVQKELEYAEKGVRVLERAGDPLSQMALGQLALVHHTMQHWEQADSLYQAGLAAATLNPRAMRVFLPNYARMKLQQPVPDPEGALALYDRMIGEFGAGLSDRDAGAYAYAKVLTGDDEAAGTILRTLKERGKDKDVTVLPWFYMIAAARGDYEQAYSSLHDMRIQENDVIYSTLGESVMEALSAFHDNQAREETRRRRVSYIWIAVAFVAVLSVAGWGFRRTRNNHRRLLELKDALETELAESESERRQAESLMMMKLDKVRADFTREKLARLRQAGSLGSIVMLQERRLIDEDLAWDSLKKDIRYIHHLEKKGEELVRRVDQELDGMVSRLRSDLKLWGKPKEVLFLCCCILGMDLQLLTELFHLTSIDAAYKKRSRLREKIRRLGNPEYSVLLKNSGAKSA
ncbi:MAG: hypothetical protein K6D54_03885 [Bacteroidales bacterium]|nr:hypothetical protein [Bacteroidales bacterium]